MRHSTRFLIIVLATATVFSCGGKKTETAKTTTAASAPAKTAGWKSGDTIYFDVPAKAGGGTDLYTRFVTAGMWGGDVRRVSLGGHSAGGNLVEAIAIKSTRTKDFKVCLQVLDYAATDNSLALLPDGLERSRAFSLFYVDGEVQLLKDPFVSPAYAPDELFEGQPDALVISAGLCPFVSVNGTYALRLAGKGVKVTIKGYPQSHHGMESGQINENFKIKGFGITGKEMVSQIGNWVRSSLIGIGIGILPGIGGSTANIIAYSVAKSSSKYPEKFGTGIIDGICASESSNNASIGGAMIPLLTLGIPGDGATAILLGGFMNCFRPALTGTQTRCLQNQRGFP